MGFGHRAHQNDPIRPFHALIAVLIVAVGAWLRGRGAGGDLWLDEIWSLNLATAMSAWHEALWKVIHDNNHPLNTIFLYLAGPDREPWVYRLSAIVAGTLSIVAVGWVMMRDGAGRMLSAMLLVAVLYPLVHFGSEARGYALMILFAYIAFGAVDQARDNPHRVRWLFGGAVMLGAASHLSILPIALMMAAAYGLREWGAGRTLWQAIKITFWFSAPAAGGLALVGGGIVYGLNQPADMGWYGGGATTCPEVGCFIAAWDQIVHFSTGGFGEGLAGLHAGLFAILMAGTVLGLLVVRQGRGYLYAAILIGAPLTYLALGQPSSPYGRYFIGVFAFAPLVVSDVVGELRTRSIVGRVLAGGALLALISANAWAATQFHKIGRGHYTKAFETISESTPGDTLSIGSDMTFRFSTVFDHVAKRAGTDKAIRYVEPGDVSRARPDWLVIVLKTESTLLDAICLGGGDSTNAPVVYRLGGVFTAWGLSGETWGVYHRLSARPPRCP